MHTCGAPCARRGSSRFARRWTPRHSGARCQCSRPPVRVRVRIRIRARLSCAQLAIPRPQPFRRPHDVSAFDFGPKCSSDEWTRLALALCELDFAEAAQFCFTHALRPSASATTSAASNLNSSYSIAQRTSSAQPSLASTSLAAALSAATRSVLSYVTSAFLQSFSAIVTRAIAETPINKPSEATLLSSAARVFCDFSILYGLCVPCY